MKSNGLVRVSTLGFAAAIVLLGAVGCSGDGGGQGPTAGGPGTVDTRATAFPGSVMPAVGGGAGNGGGVSGGGAGAGTMAGGGR